MQLPKLDDLLEDQMQIYEHPHDSNLLVAGPPGSGKTTLAVMRANFIRNTGSEVVVISRNKLLVGLAAQLGGDGFVAKTMHQFVSKHYHTTFGENAPEPTQYNYDWAQIIEDYRRHGVTPHMDHVLIDEGQNLPAGFFEWIVRFVAKVVTVFADENQTTSDSRSTLQDLVQAVRRSPFLLSVNHRNTREIAAVAEYFHRSQNIPPAMVRRPAGGEMPRLATIADMNILAAQVSVHYGNRGGSIGVIVRSMQQVTELTRQLAVALGPHTRVEGYVSSAPLGYGRIRTMDAGVTVLTSESAIGLEFNTVFLQDLERSLPCTEVEDARRMYMLCARARDVLTLVNGPVPLSPAKLDGLPGPQLLQR